MNFHRSHEYITEILVEYGGTYEFKGPIFAIVDMFFTCDPANIHHILSKNFSNYPKGSEYCKIFDVLGKGSSVLMMNYGSFIGKPPCP